MMSRDRLPLIGSSGRKTGRPPFAGASLQHPNQTNQRKHNRQPQTSSSSSSSHPSSILLSDTTVTPWGGLVHVESSFTTIPPTLPLKRPPPPPPSPPPVPPTTPSRKNKHSSFTSEIPSPCLGGSQSNAGGVSQGLRMKRKVLLQHRVPRPPRLPPLHPITNLSFSRSFTFSFFELPLHLSPHSRAEHVKNLFQLLKQIRY
ncbi:formin-I [Nothobranchius furzeri]|uniref:Formin-I-like n=2 Tax=Nothobranchius furzeri TaxID=105023 RepID=A0A9D2XXE1_NOTFU|nr:formin-I [Nothobranchius furzeri]KAF7209433.1 formin-I-like [Nothobranchius furzeri]